MAATLLQQNAWLRDPKTRAESVRISVASSSAVEGIRKPFRSAKTARVKSPAPKSGKTGR